MNEHSFNPDRTPMGKTRTQLEAIERTLKAANAVRDAWEKWLHADTPMNRHPLGTEEYDSVAEAMHELSVCLGRPLDWRDDMGGVELDSRPVEAGLGRCWVEGCQEPATFYFDGYERLCGQHHAQRVEGRRKWLEQHRREPSAREITPQGPQDG